MSNAEYKFTNENAEVRGRVAEVIEFAKSRGIFLKQIEVFKDPDALKDEDTTHEIFDIPNAECEDEGDCDGKCEGCGDSCCYNHPEYGVEDVPPEVDEDELRDILDMFRKALGFDE